MTRDQRTIIREGTAKKNLNDPPTTERPPPPRSQIAPPSKELVADPIRAAGLYNPTGIFVRVRTPDGWGNADIAQLDRGSLIRFLRSRGGENLWAENTVLAILGHVQVTAEEAARAMQ